MYVTQPFSASFLPVSYKLLCLYPHGALVVMLLVENGTEVCVASSAEVYAAVEEPAVEE